MQNDVKKFIRKLKKVKSIAIEGNSMDDVRNRVRDEGISIITKEYNNSEDVIVDGTIEDDVIKLYASHPKIAYIEYGTGVLGEGSYIGNLPVMTFTFFSERFGMYVTTSGWTYNYANRLGLTDTNWEGYPAKAHMANSAYTLRYRLPVVISEYIREELE